MAGYMDVSKQEKIIAAVLLAGIIFIILFMTAPAHVSKDGKAKAPSNVLSEAKQGTFVTPRDLVVDKEGSIYIVDSRNHRIQKFSKEGNFLSMWGKKGDGQANLNEPCGIALGPDGNIYVSDTWNSRVQVFSKAGKIVRSFGKEVGLWGPRDLGVDSKGNVYVSDTGNGKIEKFDAKGKHVGTFGKKGSGKLEFSEPFTIEQGPDGNMYIADRKNFRIQVMTTAGKYVREFKINGWADGQIVNGCLMEPYFSIDQKNKRIYVTDSPNHRVLRYDLYGKNEKVFDKDKKGMELFECPLSVAVGLDGKVFVTDSSQGKLINFTDNEQ